MSKTDAITSLPAPLNPIRLHLRPALPKDIPPLWRLMEDYQHRFFNDFDTLDREWIQALVQSGELITIDDAGYAVGVIWFSDQLADLHAEIHLLIQPQALRLALKQQLFAEILDKAFYLLQVRKIKAIAMETQVGAIKLLRRLKFKQNGLFRNETKVKGKAVDVFTFELHRKFWEKYRHGIV
jgi:RimJ/RimL family protein N-acetyltransferase